MSQNESTYEWLDAEFRKAAENAAVPYDADMWTQLSQQLDKASPQSTELNWWQRFFLNNWILVLVTDFLLIAVVATSAIALSTNKSDIPQGQSGFDESGVNFSPEKIMLIEPLQPGPTNGSEAETLPPTNSSVANENSSNLVTDSLSLNMKVDSLRQDTLKKDLFIFW